MNPYLKGVKEQKLISHSHHVSSIGQGGGLHWARKMEVGGLKNSTTFCSEFTSQSDHMATASLRKGGEVQCYHFPEGAPNTLWSTEMAAASP